VLGLHHFETTSKARFRKLVKDDEGKQSRASGLFERVWVSSIREEDSRAKRRLAVLQTTFFLFLLIFLRNFSGFILNGQGCYSTHVVNPRWIKGAITK
jgi:hypothetical protein